MNIYDYNQFNFGTIYHNYSYQLLANIASWTKIHLLNENLARIPFINLNNISHFLNQIIQINFIEYLCLQ